MVCLRVAAPGVTVEGDGTAPAVLRANGASNVCVPWLPCANAERAAALPLRFDPATETIAVAGFDAAPPAWRHDLVAALDAVASRRDAMRILVLTNDGAANELVRHFGGRAESVSLLATDAAGRFATAGVVHAGLTDPAAFGNVLLAQAELPSIVVNDDLRAIFARDVATYAGGDASAAIERVLADADLRLRNARLGSADARRRFSPRRSAVRVVDVLCAARFGLERPEPARTNSPLER